jgi:hypothetical protein
MFDGQALGTITRDNHNAETMRAKRIAVTFKFEVTIPEWIVFTDA